MCRKLTLVGWVLLISEDFEQARVLVALLVSILFLLLHLSIRPLRRCVEERTTDPQRLFTDPTRTPTCLRAEDGLLMTLIEVALILVYACVLVMKVCDQSSVARSGAQHDPRAEAMAKRMCSTFGFGDSANGAAGAMIMLSFGRLVRIRSHFT
jgi:hypothetical protein